MIAWQNEMLNYRDKNGKAYSPTYLKTLHGQLSAILNHAVRFYGLKSNAAATAGCMGSEYLISCVQASVSLIFIVTRTLLFCQS